MILYDLYGSTNFEIISNKGNEMKNNIPYSLN